MEQRELLSMTPEELRAFLLELGEPGYRADVSTSSGSFDYTVPLAKDGGGYVCGDGSGSLKVSVTSGTSALNTYLLRQMLNLPGLTPFAPKWCSSSVGTFVPPLKSTRRRRRPCGTPFFPALHERCSS